MQQGRGVTQEQDDYGSLRDRQKLSTRMSSTNQIDYIDLPSISYWEFLTQNRNYRWYISSFLITHFGEWLTYIASIDFVETVREKQGQSMSRTAISILIVVRLLPNVILSGLGGTMADALDRRHIMIALDICGALCAGLFILAWEMESIGLLYVATACQQCIAGLYNPSHSAIVPQLVESDAQLKKATTLEGLTWSAMQAFGAAASGWIVGALGIRMCFVVDGISYAISAFLLAFVRGSYKVVVDPEKESSSLIKSTDIQPTNSTESLWQKFHNMVVEGVRYLQGSYFGPLIFLKGTAALGFGACDILNVAFSEQKSYSETHRGDGDSGSDAFDLVSSNRKLGILFSLVGVGCLVGPLIAEPWVHVERPITLQISCIISFGLSALGYFGWATIPYFWSTAIFAVVRAAGSSNIWIHSTLMLQKFSAPHMLGRVLAADYAVALMGEASAALLCGTLMDHHTDWTPYQVSWVLALITSAITMGWLTYHLMGQGAGQYHPTSVLHSETTAMNSTALSGSESTFLIGHRFSYHYDDDAAN